MKDSKSGTAKFNIVWITIDIYESGYSQELLHVQLPVKGNESIISAIMQNIDELSWLNIPINETKIMVIPKRVLSKCTVTLSFRE